MLAKGILPIFVSNTLQITSHKNVYLSLKINLIFSKAVPSALLM